MEVTWCGFDGVGGGGYCFGLSLWPVVVVVVCLALVVAACCGWWLGVWGVVCELDSVLFVCFCFACFLFLSCFLVGIAWLLWLLLACVWVVVVVVGCFWIVFVRRV